MKPATAVFIGVILLALTGTGLHGEPASLARDNHMADLIRRVKASTMAVGTYKFTEKPPIRMSGTGFVTGDGRLVVTNYHVVHPIKEAGSLFHLRIFHKDLPDKGVKARLAAEDPFHDLAILKIDRPLPPLTLAGDGQVKEGHGIAFTGYPIGLVLGLNPTTHTGIVSAIAPIILPSPHGSLINGSLIKHLKDTYDIMQLDAVAYPGNSGSPVYRIATGEVVGVINKVFIKGKKEHILKNPTGITYAIPVKFVRTLADSLSN